MLSEWLAWRKREEEELRAEGGGDVKEEVEIEEGEGKVVEEIMEEVLDEVEEIMP